MLIVLPDMLRRIHIIIATLFLVLFFQLVMPIIMAHAVEPTTEPVETTHSDESEEIGFVPIQANIKPTVSGKTTNNQNPLGAPPQENTGQPKNFSPPAPAPNIPDVKTGQIDTSINQSITGPTNSDDDKNLEYQADAFKITDEELDNPGHLLELYPYNPYMYVAKAVTIFPVERVPFSTWTYGPYTPDADLYAKDPKKIIKELNERMNILSIEINSAKKEDPYLVEKKIHYADLSLMAWIYSQNPIDTKRAVEFYGQIYNQVTAKFSTAVSLNLINANIHTNTAITALPLIKKLQKNMATYPDILRKVNALLIEHYFLEGRHAKIDEMLTRTMKKNEVNDQSEAFKLRMGDNMFFLKRFAEAAEWYGQVLKPKSNSSHAENVSWLYFAEALMQTGNLTTGTKIYQAMKPYFEKQAYRGIIDYRLSKNFEEGTELLDLEKNSSVAAFIRIDLVRRQYEVNPLPYTSDVIQNMLKSKSLNAELEERLLLIKADALQREKKYYESAKIYHTMEVRSHNSYVDQMLIRQIVACLYNQSLLNKTEEDAVEFLRNYHTYEFHFRSLSPKKITTMLKRNLELMGLEQASPEMVLSAIEKSVQDPKTKVGLIFELAKSMYDIHAVRTAWRLMEDVDIKLLSYEEQEDYYRYLIKGFIDLGKLDKAIEQLDAWQKKGTTAKNTYWIILKKTELNYDIGQYDKAHEQVEDTLGSSDVSLLPDDYQAIITDLLVYRTLLFNKLGKDTDCLNSFETHKERMLKSEYKQEVIMSAISSGMRLQKERDVKKYLELAKMHMDKKTSAWLEKWATGEIWNNQIVGYLNKAEKFSHQDTTEITKDKTEDKPHE